MARPRWKVRETAQFYLKEAIVVVAASKLRLTPLPCLVQDPAGDEAGQVLER